jgi:SAM-dependent MidA family methyltransferase
MINQATSLLVDKIFTKINHSPGQKITFAEYMEMCLYDPEFGYYNSHLTKIGNQGDFFTSASLSADLGELLAKQLYQFWQILDQPSSFHLVEMGAGEGVLAQVILNYISQEYPEFYQAVNYIIIEKSVSLRQKQQQLLNNFTKQGLNLHWCNWDDLADNSLVGCFFSNELVDAFPVHLVCLNNDLLQEIYITAKNNQLVAIKAEISTQKIIDYFKLINIQIDSDIYPANYQTEVNLEALLWLKKVSSKLKQGYLLTIDYGYTADKYYHPQRSQGTLQCYYQHRYHDNPLVNIGCQDLTSHVNFTALIKYGTMTSLNTLAYSKQALFLMSLGLGERLNALSNEQISLPLIWQRRNQLHQLINPEGLGGFGVLLQAKNLTCSQQEIPLLGFVDLPYDDY